jgi:UDP-N-acetylglucosamine 4,6-dehydratase
MKWSESTVLLTGGTGSFGKTFTRILLGEHHPKRIIIFSRDELKQEDMRRTFPDTSGSSVTYFVGDVRDINRLTRAMEGADVVVHAAAMKQIPTCESHPMEAVMTNVLGSANIIEAAGRTGVRKVLYISTDKAVSPVSTYGATKLLAEKLFVEANGRNRSGSISFSCVRYGNVVGTRGSVIPRFIDQRAGGKVTITDRRMTRFCLTLEQGSQFVIRAIETMQGGEIFVPRVPSINIMELTRAIAPDCEVKIIGIRPGEKVHEQLLSVEESAHAIELDDMFIIEPQFPWWRRGHWKLARPVPANFAYTSDGTARQLTATDLLEMMRAYESTRALVKK